MSRQLQKARARWYHSGLARRRRHARVEKIGMGEVSPAAILGGAALFFVGVGLFGGWAGKTMREEEERRGQR